MGEHSTEQQSSVSKSVLQLVLMAAVIVTLAFLLRTFVFSPYEIPSSSMEETIQIGDIVFSEKVSYYIGEPKAGDIVTFIDPENENRTLIKRCIATEGQVVDLQNGVLLIDGVAQDEEYTSGKPSYELNGSTIQFPYTVPEGYIWVMGDNRTNSSDSRAFGAVPISSVTGRAAIIYWPINRITLL